MNDRLIRFGTEVKKLRLEKGFSQEVLAKKSGFSSRQAIQLIEKGKTDISIERLGGLSKALGVSPSYFFDYIVVDQSNQQYLIDATKNLSPSGMDMLKLYIENLKKIPGMTIDNDDNN